MRIVIDIDEVAVRNPDQKDFDTMTPREVAGFLELIGAAARHQLRQPIAFDFEDWGSYDPDDAADIYRALDPEFAQFHGLDDSKTGRPHDGELINS